MDVNHSSSSTNSSLNSLIDHKTVPEAQLLIRKLKMLSANREPIADEITAFYNSTNADHLYISQILFASGFWKDFEPGFTAIHLHPTGNPININVFLALEEAMAGTTNFNKKHSGKKRVQSEPHAKTQRKLIFDVVNEILEHKMLLENSSKQWLSTNMLAGKIPRRKQLLEELCSEVDRLQHNNSNCNLDDENDSFRSILWADLIHQSTHWTAFHDEIPGLVLDVERLIFKDLINEVVTGQAIGQQTQFAGHCRQIISK